MKNSTNILLIVVIILLVALLVDKRIESNTLKADSGGAINNVIFTMDPLIKERFFIFNTGSNTVLYYEFDQSTKSILLKATRQVDYDYKLLGAYKAAGNQGDSYNVIKSVIDNQDKPKK